MLIGLWLMLILLFLAMAELTFLVHYFTRFSEEVFIGITGFFFFYEACLSIVHVSSTSIREWATRLHVADSWGGGTLSLKLKEMQLLI